MRTIKIFIFSVPVIGEAKTYRFTEDDYRWWTIWDQGFRNSLTVRETVGKVSLQQRIENFLRRDAGLMSARALLKPFAAVPASDRLIEAWKKSHPEEMKSFVGIVSEAEEEVDESLR